MIGQLTSAEFATSEGTMTLINIVSGNVQPGVTIAEQYYQQAFPSTTLGNASLTFTAVTTDPQILGKVMQGTRVTGIKWVFGGVGIDINASTMVITKEGAPLNVTCDFGQVVEVIELAADHGSKEPSQFTISIKATKNPSTGADPEIKHDTATATPPPEQ